MILERNAYASRSTHFYIHAPFTLMDAREEFWAHV
jgi:hypothetical protein